MPKRPPLPDRLDVGPHRFRIIHDHDGMLPADHARGWTDSDRLTIALDVALPRDVVAEVALHEAIHAMLRPLALDEAVEEAVATNLGVALLDLLRRNPALVAYVVG